MVVYLHARNLGQRQLQPGHFREGADNFILQKKSLHQIKHERKKKMKQKTEIENESIHCVPDGRGDIDW
jgi:hypothetical protein